MKRSLLLLLLPVMLITGCGSRPAIPVNEQQTLVMESSVLAAGISAEKPDISSIDGATVSQSELYNERSVPVTVNYRFYWYDAKGLEIHPLEKPRSVSIPAKSTLTVSSTAGYPDARKVRLYLSL
ncbi:YcfL family protein [Enterobacteriaceae bacterium H20N1]|uniref:YcfL family protein n=1 Tax=Dryocola boscaweniae TaxID=2925397 RepID=A0A9X2WCV6_9ENTR|nr:YcfL family protein [Dryocola boscaweniae]MCT4704204.1 YcfL family protein [Dryocola boscaweniae]MCT4717391.1 YcfL family protein [Dryocola boscaweniae]MCT4721372.1 YcfL family protein [Dryocola boscaweniae]